MARVPYVSPDDLDEEHRNLLESSFQDKPLNVYAALGNEPDVLAGMREYFGSLWTHEGLTARQREILILTAADEADSAYERHQHENIAPDAGVTTEEMKAIVADEREGFDDEEALLIEYCRAVIREDVTDDLHEEMAETFGTDTTVVAANIAGAYLGLSRVIEALALDIEPE